MIKKFLVFVVLLFLSTTAFAADGFSSVIDDMPLMPGMSERADDAVVFDKPGGRIIETTAETKEAPDAVRAFYAQALPPLGWKEIGANGFTRADENLKLGFEQKSGETLVHFSLTPAKEK